MSFQTSCSMLWFGVGWIMSSVMFSLSSFPGKIPTTLPDFAAPTTPCMCQPTDSETSSENQNSSKNVLRGTTIDSTTSSENRKSSKTAPLPTEREERNPRRKFLSYESSEWELMWLEHVDQWERERSICQQLLDPMGDQASYLREFLNATCTSRMGNWCVFQDTVHQLWYDPENTSMWDFREEKPPELKGYPVPEPQPVIPTSQHERVLSKFTFLDEETGKYYVEYIEPLVSHLRHPLAKCLFKRAEEDILLVDRSYILAPQRTVHSNRSLYFDAGASSWKDGTGGPSLGYFVDVWQRHGVMFDGIYAFEAKTHPAKFYRTIPKEWKNRTHFQKTYVTSSVDKHTEENPFLPTVISQKAHKGDYVLFKLDIDSAGEEEGTINYLLSPDGEDTLERIDELLWEHHIHGNYLMREHWGFQKTPDVTIRGSYEYFLRLRKAGVRAHSWV